MKYLNASLLLRISIAFAFLYPPISAIIHPLAWIGYFPKFILALPVDQLIILHTFGVIEIIIALWILSGKKIFIPCVLAIVFLALIVFFNFAQIDVVFRDISILIATLALIFLNRSPREKLIS